MAALLVAAPEQARADETFLCEDGGSITIDSTNRAMMQDHPCVRAWFVSDLARRQARADAGDARARGASVVHRHPVRRAMALRDLQQRPAYLAWVRTRVVETQPAARWNGGRQAHFRSLLDKPAARTTTKSAIRIRYRRR